MLPASVRLTPGDTLSLVVGVFDAQGNALTGVPVSFHSDVLSVATVSSAGLIRAMALGTANITVTAGPVSSTVAVTVVGAPWAIQVSPASARLVVGDSVALTAQVLDARGQPLTGVTVAFQSGNASVVSVTAGAAGLFESVGVVRAAGAGTTSILVAAGALHTSVPVSVILLQVSPFPITVSKDSTVQLMATVRDSTGALVANPALTFRSADTTVATVSAAGLVRGIRFGTTSIAVTFAGFTTTVAAYVGAHAVGLLDQTVPLGLRPYGVAVSPAGVIYVTQLDGATVSRAQLPTVAFASAIGVGQVPTDVAFNSTGTTAYVANQFSSNVGVIDVAASRQVDSIPLASGTPFRVLVSRDDRTVYVATNNGAVLAFDAATKALRAQYNLSGAINGLALPPTGPLLYATDLLGGALYEINTSTGVIRGAYAGGAPQDVVVSLDGTTLYVADESGALQLRSVATGGLLSTVPAVTGAFGLKLSPDGAALWVSAPSAGSLYVVNTTTLVAQTIATGITPRRIAFGQNGAVAVVSNENGSVLVFK